MSEADLVGPHSTVSVVLLNYKGADDTITCLRHLGEIDWPTRSLEVICVDNASGDGSAERIRSLFPDITLIESPRNTGFTGGCNLGAAHATGEYLAFLNNDARPDRGWIRAAVAELERSPSVGAVASKVLDWEGRTVDFVSGELAWYGMGYKREFGDPVDRAFDEPKDVLFGTGSALITRRDLFSSVGGFDERFFMFFEDVDYGWRLNLLGWTVRYVPDSVVYHRHHTSMKSYGAFHEDFLLDRNALLMLYKNLSDELLASILPAALAFTARRAVDRGKLDATSLDLTRASEHRGSTTTVEKTALAGLFALDSFVENLDELTATRRELQQRRRRSDADIVPLFGESVRLISGGPSVVRAHQVLVETFGIAALLPPRRRILIVTGDQLSARMAGPAIRAWNLAGLLGREHDVRLATVHEADVTSPHFEIVVTPVQASRSMDEHVEWADVILFQGYALNLFPALQQTDKVMICDLYDPMHLEQLEQARELGPERWRHEVSTATEALNVQLRRSDFFVCANDRQRHFWLGQLAALGRLNPDNYSDDETMERLIGIAPFGLERERPVQTRHAIKGAVDGIGPDDKVIIWAGGVYNWFDPVTLVRAVAELAERRPSVRLFFLGMKHPNPHVPQMRAATQARALAEELGLTDKHVFFNERWVDYADRQNYLLDADAGVTTHYQHVETTFAFRTRILDYLWAGLPIVTTGGDSFGELVSRQELGLTVGQEDVSALADALEIVLFDDDFAARARANIAKVREEFTWEKALDAVVQFCRDPHTAPDRLRDVPLPRIIMPHVPPKVTVRGDVQLFREYLKAGGVKEVLTRARGRIRRVTGRGPQR